ncbi:MAG: tetratricopeptide repeat protein [Actinomycetota bacterium]|nr:tetratricopeptide repeat protein [Actinomycetota bacterium]
MTSAPFVVDTDEASFEHEVVERSREVPVVVDFWAAWCGPCRTLGPLLEQAVSAREGEVVLAKVDIDGNPRLAARFGVRSIPAVKAFRDGSIVGQFVGALPRRQVEAFLDQLQPSEADRAATAATQLLPDDPEAAETVLRQALELDPRHRVAALELAHLIVERAPDEALELLAPHRPEPKAEQLAARAELARSGGDVDVLRARVNRDPGDASARLALGRALAASGAYEEAIEELLAAVRGGGPAREEAREQLVALFRLMGEGDSLVATARKRLAAALY